MQHQLFHSKLKQSVEDSSLLEMIETSSSGENPHRAATMEMIFERSIQEHRERAALSAKEPTTQHPLAKSTGEKPTTVEPTVAGKKPLVVKPTVTEEKPATAKPTVTEEKLVITKDTPFKPKKKQAPPPKLPSESVNHDPWAFLLDSQFRTKPVGRS